MRIIPRPTDLEGGIVLGGARFLDEIARLDRSTGPDDLAQQGPALVRRFGIVAVNFCLNDDQLEEVAAADLLDTWAYWVVEMAARWHRGDPLAMSPFRSSALKALAAARTDR